MSRPNIGDLIPIGGGGYSLLSNVENLAVTGQGDQYIKITWADPDDVVLDGITITEWAGTQIRVKTGNYPAHEKDGVLVLDSKVRDAHKTTDLTITGLANDVEHFIMAFPYTDKRVFTVDAANRVKATPSEADDVWGTPGAGYLLAGDMAEGFFGEVSQGDFITFADLTTACSITQGTAYNASEPWLKFAYNGIIQFVPRKPIRHSISWDHLNTKKCVYGDSGDTVVQIGDHYFKVRLFRALEPSNDPKTTASATSGVVCYGSEWNRLMCRIHEQAYDESWAYPSNVESPIAPLMHSLGSGNQGLYTDADLLTHSNHGSGCYSWCQEMSTSSTNRLSRGFNGVSYSLNSASSTTSANRGWRPALELVQGP